MFDNRHHFDWKPENSQTWVSRVSDQGPAQDVNKTTKPLPARAIAPFISEHEMTLTARYPTCAPLDPFGRDD